MGILDEAIREHLELKRQHGADDSELKQLEDDAFGPPERPGGSEPPDAASEAATEFMQQPDLGGSGGDRAEAEAQAAVEVPQAPPPAARRESVADVQEAPEKAEEEEEVSDEVPAAEEIDEQPAGEEPDDGPAEEEQPAEEHEAVTSPPPPAGHTTAERHAIADQPTEMYDVEEDFGSPAASKPDAPSDEDLAVEEETEPRMGPAEPIAEPDLDDEDEDDDFFDEQRLSDELDQALEAPAEPDSEEYEPAADQYEGDKDEQEEEAGSEAPAPPAASDKDEDEDLLEDTPDFLEESPEDDQLWFEQKPPKDFDFDD
jgi:CapZ-interacting protein